MRRSPQLHLQLTTLGLHKMWMWIWTRTRHPPSLQSMMMNNSLVYFLFIFLTVIPNNIELVEASCGSDNMPELKINQTCDTLTKSRSSRSKPVLIFAQSVHFLECHSTRPSQFIFDVFNPTLNVRLKFVQVQYFQYSN